MLKTTSVPECLTPEFLRKVRHRIESGEREHICIAVSYTTWEERVDTEGHRSAIEDILEGEGISLVGVGFNPDFLPAHLPGLRDEDAFLHMTNSQVMQAAKEARVMFLDLLIDLAEKQKENL